MANRRVKIRSAFSTHGETGALRPAGRAAYIRHVPDTTRRNMQPSSTMQASTRAAWTGQMPLSTTTNRHGADLAYGDERLHTESRGPAALPASTGVRVDRLERLLGECPAVPREEREIVVRRFREGADIGYSGPAGGRVTANNRSATMRVDGVTAAVDREVRAGATRGPFAVPPYSDLVINALSARDKPNGDVRLILDLSQPVGSAVNEGIDPEQFRVVYTSIDEAIRLLHRVGGTEAQIFKAQGRGHGSSNFQGGHKERI